MATRRGEPTKKSRLKAILADRRPALIDIAVFHQLQSELAPISESYLEDLLRDSGIPLDPVVEGVSLHSPEDLRRTLLALAELYEITADTRLIRGRVIAAKTRLRALIARTSFPELRREREQMHLELMTWLENPGIFAMWLRLRRNASETMKGNHDSRD
jgi:hypothetical protein